MAHAEGGDLLQRRRQTRELTAQAQPLDGTQLIVCRSARPHQIGVIRVREAVCARTCRAHDGLFLKDEDSAARSGEREQIRYRLESLRVRKCVSATVGDSKRNPFRPRHVRDELRGLDGSGPDLQMRGAWATERSGAEKRAANVSATTAGAGDDAARRSAQWRESLCEHSCFMKDLERVRLSRDVKLVARRLLERALPVGPDLRRDVELPQQAERPARDSRGRDVDVHGDLAATEKVHPARRVQEAGQLRESVARAARGDRGELVAQVVREHCCIPRARAAVACTRCRANRTSRCRRRRRPGGTEERAGTGSAHRTFPLRVVR